MTLDFSTDFSIFQDFSQYFVYFLKPFETFLNFSSTFPYTFPLPFTFLWFPPTLSDSSLYLSLNFLNFFRLFSLLIPDFSQLFQTLLCTYPNFQTLLRTFPWLFPTFTDSSLYLSQTFHFTHRLHPTSCFTHWTVYQCMFEKSELQPTNWIL